MLIYGGCGLINDFDVMGTTFLSTSEITYGAPTGLNDAVISQMTNNGWADVGVVLSGLSLMDMRDDETDGALDRAVHLRDRWKHPCGRAPHAFWCEGRFSGRMNV